MVLIIKGGNYPVSRIFTGKRYTLEAVLYTKSDAELKVRIFKDDMKRQGKIGLYRIIERKKIDSITGFEYLVYLREGREKKTLAPKYQVNDMVYSWQNPSVRRRVSHVQKGEDGYPNKYKVCLYDKEGYTYSSKWMNESSLSYRRRQNY